MPLPGAAAIRIIIPALPTYEPVPTTSEEEEAGDPTSNHSTHHHGGSPANAATPASDSYASSVYLSSPAGSPHSSSTITARGVSRRQDRAGRLVSVDVYHLLTLRLLAVVGVTAILGMIGWANMPSNAVTTTTSSSSSVGRVASNSRTYPVYHVTSVSGGHNGGHYLPLNTLAGSGGLVLDDVNATYAPTASPTTAAPTFTPTPLPTAMPTLAPTASPTAPPTPAPTTAAPTPAPTAAPTRVGKVAMRQCHDKVKAYGAAWLASKDQVLRTHFGDREVGEPASFYMFEGGRALKTWDYRDMWVEHLSGLEAILRGTHTNEEPEAQALLEDSLHRAEMICDGLQLGSEPPEVSTVVVLPFWTAFGAQQTPKFNSQVGLNGRIQQVKGTVCSTRRYFSRVVAGVCKNMPRDYAQGKHDGEILRELGLPLHDIWEFDCPRGSSLIYQTLREARSRLSDGRLQANYLYYTEMDQVLNIRASSVEKLHTLYDWVDGGTYVAPNRLDVVYEPAFWRGFNDKQIEENIAFEHMVLVEGTRYRQWNWCECGNNWDGDHLLCS